MAASAISAVLSFVPVNIWRLIKKFVTKDGIVVFDAPFKISTKYTPALLMVMMCLSFANQFVRNVEMDCTDSRISESGGRTNAELMDLNTYCWNFETFLVERALLPEMRGRVTYPGISGYDKGHDEIVRQRYYKYVWMGIGKLAVLTFLPLFLWKFRGTAKIQTISEISAQPGTEEDMRVSAFSETIGFNAGFALHYLACKLLASATPIIAWYYLCGFLGGRYKYYGIDVMQTFMDTSDHWPSPMDALFPKVAKCEWAKYGISGDRELRSAQCQLPMNNLTQWSFFIFWWWLVFVFVLNFFSCLRLLLFVFPPFRNYRYKKFVAIMCRDDIDKVLVDSGLSGKRTPHSVLKIHLNFGEWLVLSLLKKNIKEWQFRAFIRRLSISRNSVIQIKLPPKPVGYTNGAAKGGNYFQNIQAATSPVTDPNNTTIPIGFRESVLEGIQPNGNPHPPAYIKCEPDTSDYEIDMRALLESQREEAMLNHMRQSQSPSRTPSHSADTTLNDQYQQQGHHQQSPYGQMGFNTPMAASTPSKNKRDKKNPLECLARFAR